MSLEASFRDTVKGTRELLKGLEKWLEAGNQHQDVDVSITFRFLTSKKKDC